MDSIVQPKREEHCCSEELIDGVALALLVDAIMPLFYPHLLLFVLIAFARAFIIG